jgi:hypothetical protein
MLITVADKATTTPKTPVTITAFVIFQKALPTCGTWKHVSLFSRSSTSVHSNYSSLLVGRSHNLWHADFNYSNTALYTYVFQRQTSGGHAVAQLIEAPRYKSEGRGFDFRWCHWNFSLTQSSRPPYDCGVDSASNRNVYQEKFVGSKGGRCLRLTTLPSSRADCLEIWGPEPPGTLRAYPGLFWDCFTYIILLTTLLASEIGLARFHFSLIYNLGLQN